MNKFEELLVAKKEAALSDMKDPKEKTRSDQLCEELESLFDRGIRVTKPAGETVCM